MNLLLLEAAELDGSGELWLEGRRARHLREVLRVSPGRTLRAGLVDGAVGQAEVLALQGERVRIRFQPGLLGPEPASPPIELILALPRPKVLRRVLRAMAALAISRLELCNAWRVEKSYFGSPLLEEQRLREELLLGCEQGGHPRLPRVGLQRLLVPFLETLPAPGAEEVRLLADPAAEAGADRLGRELAGARLIRAAVGPEGGWIDAERESFLGRGFCPISLGPQILSSEVAAVVLIGQLRLLARL